ncbi:MAG: DGQHR domain-containing protein, partial [Candidatus Absconditabacteria bacterium]
MNIKTLNISQGLSKIYIGKIKFSELKKIARFFIRTSTGSGINRETNPRKIQDICNYIIKNIDSNIPIFPTPMVISLDSDYGVEYNGNEMIIPDDKEEIALIIDGQHRFKGIELYLKTNENTIDLELPIIILLDYDTYELSEIFANINFKQKPVNRSLYYDIFGSLPPEDGTLNEMQLSHNLVKFLNSEVSPISGIIKVLGSGNGLVSQSFIVDIFIVFYRNEYIWKKYIEKQNLIEKFLIEYFSFIKEFFKKYNYNIDEEGKYITNGHVLWKTTGFGAIL